MPKKVNKIAELEPKEFYKQAMNEGQVQQVIKYLVRHFFTEKTYNADGFSLNDIDQRLTLGKPRNGMRMRRLSEFVGMKKDKNGKYHRTLSEDQMYQAIYEHFGIDEVMALQLYTRNLKAMFAEHIKSKGLMTTAEKREKRREYMRKYRANKAKEIAKEQRKQAQILFDDKNSNYHEQSVLERAKRLVTQPTKSSATVEWNIVMKLVNHNNDGVVIKLRPVLDKLKEEVWGNIAALRERIVNSINKVREQGNIESTQDDYWTIPRNDTLPMQPIKSFSVFEQKVYIYQGLLVELLIEEDE